MWNKAPTETQDSNQNREQEPITMSMPFSPTNYMKFWIAIFKEPIGWAAFGLVVIVILTQYLFWPLLAQRQLDYEQLSKITADQKETAVTLNSVAQSMENTAQSMTLTATIMDKTVDRLERMEDNKE
jgi:hypothetical protein